MNSDTVRKCVARARDQNYLLPLAGQRHRYDKVVAYYHGKAVELLMDAKGIKHLPVSFDRTNFVRNQSESGFLVPITADERDTFSKELGLVPPNFAASHWFWLFFEDGGWEGEPLTAQVILYGSFEDVPYL